MHLRSQRLLLGVSGGADSVALLRAFHALAGANDLTLAVAHLDHALREESADDAGWVCDLAEGLGLACLVERTNLDHFSGTSEERARDARYEFFRFAARQESCRFVLTAHTADDQVETVLHQMLRGSGLRGLSGIPAERSIGQGVKLIRPLLNVTRNEILEYLNSLSQNFRVDPTNALRDFTRNRIRHEILPLLRSEINPRVDDALLRLARQAQESQLVIEFSAARLRDQCQQECAMDLVRLACTPQAAAAVAREMFVEIWQSQHWPRQELGSAHLELLSRMLLSGSPVGADFPGGISARVRRGVLELRRAGMSR